MKKVCFVISHLGSNSLNLLNILNENPRIQIQNQNSIYKHPSDLDWLFNQGHKLNNASAIYGDHLTNNICFCCKPLYKHCKFIYLISPAKSSINQIVNQYNYSPLSAVRYYTFRLRRIYEMFRRTPDSVFIHNKISNEDLSLIEQYLNLKDKLYLKETEIIEKNAEMVDFDLIQEAQKSYEKYLYLTKEFKV